MSSLSLLSLYFFQSWLLELCNSSFFKWANPGLFFIYFWSFQTNKTIFTTIQCEKFHIHSVNGAGIRTHDLLTWVVSHNHQNRTPIQVLILFTGHTDLRLPEILDSTLTLKIAHLASKYFWFWNENVFFFFICVKSISILSDWKAIKILSHFYNISNDGFSCFAFFASQLTYNLCDLVAALTMEQKIGKPILKIRKNCTCVQNNLT